MTEPTGRTYETTNRELENFLYAHDIFYRSWYKSHDFLTTWVYDVTPEFQHVVNEYGYVLERRRQRKLSA